MRLGDQFMANKLYYFTCLNRACEDRENYVELPDGEYKRTKFLLFCANCGVCLVSDADRDALISEGKSWLPCIPFTGPGARMTRGPVPDELEGYRWGDPSGNANLTEKEFMNRYGINPRVDWCRRTHHANRDICKGKGQIPAAIYGPVPPKPHPRPPRPR